MISSFVLAIAAALAIGQATPPAPDSLVGPGRAVPYIGQEPMLCGGAAIAMVSRFWGQTGLYATDFIELVRPELGGVLTTDLEKALQTRGHETRVLRDRPDLVFEALAQGIPPIVLLGSPNAPWHYVVLVQASPGLVWVHDPALGPARRMSRAELEEEWSASRHWAVLAGPSSAAAQPSGATRAVEGPTEVTPDSVAERAVHHIRAGRHAEAHSIARELLTGGAAQVRLGHRVMATSLFLSGDSDAALREWNLIDEPRIDLLTVHGASASRHDVWVRRLGLAEGRQLTLEELATARQRLGSEPSVESSRIEYRPNRDGTVQVHAHVLERSRVPSRLQLMTEGTRAVLDQEVAFEVGPILASGDRWRLNGRWSEAQANVGGRVQLSAPPMPGIVTLGVGWTRERYAPAGTSDEGPSEGRMRGELGLHEWIGPHTQVGANVGLERTDEGERLVTAGAHWLEEHHAVMATLEGSGGVGSFEAYGRGRVELRVPISFGDRHRLRWLGAAEATSSRAPRLVWPGAGNDDLRPDLMRGYSLAEDGAISGPAFGRTLLITNLDYRIAITRLGPIRAGVGMFGEVAHVRRTLAGDAGSLADAGVEAFIVSGETEAALSIARGARGWVLAAGLRESW